MRPHPRHPLKPIVQPFRGLTARGVLDRSGDLHSEETRNRDAETTAAHFWLATHRCAGNLWQTKPLADWRCLIWTVPEP
jgi:hypothetical protein